MTWSSTEVGVLARAVSRAPSVYNSQPWTIEAHPDWVDLYERFEVSLPRHDPTGRDRVISCGAALTNLRLALCALGWGTKTTLLPDSERPDLVARVSTNGRQVATGPQVEAYLAIFRRHSYRAPFSLTRPAPAELRELTCAVAETGTEARVIDARTESEPLAELLGYAGSVLRDDHAYQRELSAWTAQIPHAADSVHTLPWSGLIHADTHLPDRITLTERLMREGLLVLLTPDDTRMDHFHAGAALEEIWLAAVARGLVASVLTQPLHLPEVRAGLIERLGLPGYPQAILRVGHPAAPEPKLAERRLSANRSN